MKQIFILIITVCTCAISVTAQKGKTEVVIPQLPVNAETGLISYNGKSDSPGSTMNELYSKALAWANSYYKNPADVIREKDPGKGKIVIKARYRLHNEPDKKGTVTSAGDAMYTMTIEVKDGRYRYEITRFNWMKTSAFPAERWKDDKSPLFVPEYAYYLKQTDELMKELTANFSSVMGVVASEKKDDW